MSVTNSLIIDSISVNKPVGKLKVDDKGYYRLLLSKFNVFSSGGEYYPWAGRTEAAFKSDVFLEGIRNGFQRSEVDHPTLVETMSNRDIAARMWDIQGKNTCATTRSVEIEHQSSGEVWVYGWVKPFGVMKSTLQDSLDEELVNTAFSIRAKSTRTGAGVNRKVYIDAIINWDLVTRPGIHGVNQFSSFAVERFKTFDLSDTDVQEILKYAEEKDGGGFTVEADKAYAKSLAITMKSCIGSSCLIDHYDI